MVWWGAVSNSASSVGGDGGGGGVAQRGFVGEVGAGEGAHGVAAKLRGGDVGHQQARARLDPLGAEDHGDLGRQDLGHRLRGLPDRGGGDHEQDGVRILQRHAQVRGDAQRVGQGGIGEVLGVAALGAHGGGVILPPGPEGDAASGLRGHAGERRAPGAGADHGDAADGGRGDGCLRSVECAHRAPSSDVPDCGAGVSLKPWASRPEAPLTEGRNVAAASVIRGDGRAPATVRVIVRRCGITRRNIARRGRSGKGDAAVGQGRRPFKARAVGGAGGGKTRPRPD